MADENWVHAGKRQARRAGEWARQSTRSRLARAGYEIRRVDPQGQGYRLPSYADAVALPQGAADYLRAENPRLIELQQSYAAFSSPASVPTQWSDDFLKSNLSLQWFRGDNAYVWQQRKFQDSYSTRLYLTLLDIASRDTGNLIELLGEDGLFGSLTFTFGDRPVVSRDLLDSVNELNYLSSHIDVFNTANLKILDIGAGYGRLAHRTAQAAPGLTSYDCVDAVATSTFLCEYYLRFRKLPSSVRAVPLNELHKLHDKYDLAVNIHSFSECSIAATQWWLERVAERQVKWLMIIPNTAGRLLSMESDGSSRDYFPLVLDAGYELVDNRPVHGDAELRGLIGVTDEFFLFRTTAGA